MRVNSPSSIPRGEPNIPTTLAEAHAALERTLSAETLAAIDTMASEDDMIQYHMGLGTGLRNSWGLWRGSSLATHMEKSGFTHPDHMSGVVLETFWCKRHGRPFRLEERAAAAREWANTTKRVEQEKEDRIRESNETVRNRMMGLRFEMRDVPVVQMPLQNGMNVRFMCPFHKGVFFTAYCQGSIPSHEYTVTDGYYTDPVSGEYRQRPDMDGRVARGFHYDRTARELRKMKPGEDIYTIGFHFDLTDRRIRLIRMPEVNNVYSVAVVGGRAWFAGMTDGKPVLVGIGEGDRVTAPTMPQEDEIPDLGMDGQLLLAVHSKTIYRLEGRQWKLVYSGDILLPRSGLPPQRHGNRVFLRDKGVQECRKRFWWLDMGDKPHLRLLACDTGLFESVIQKASGNRGKADPASWTPNQILALDDKTYVIGTAMWDGVYVLNKGDDGRWSCASAERTSDTVTWQSMSPFALQDVRPMDDRTK